MISRRRLLKILGLLAYFLFTGNRTAVAQFFFRPKKKMPPRLRENLFTEGGRALAGAAGGTDIKETIREAVSLIGGFGKLDLKGKSVLVKPNVVSGEKNPATTNPEVVRAVVKLLYEEGASKVYVGLRHPLHKEEHGEKRDKEGGGRQRRRSGRL